MRKITGLFVYPIKSMRGHSLATAEVGERGLLHDRSWMLVDVEGKFLTQRQLPKMAKIVPVVTETTLTIGSVGCGSVLVLRERWTDGPLVTVRVWDDACEAVDQGDEVAQWCSDYLGVTSRLVYMPSSTKRPSRRLEDGRDVRVGFMDRYPLLVASEESLAFLNGLLSVPVPMNRFRPNIVVAECAQPFEEDMWHTFVAGGVEFRGVKRCSRCPIIMTDQQTGERTGKEPLATLAKFRRVGKKVYFGMNVNHLGTGMLYVGDKIEVVHFAMSPA